MLTVNIIGAGAVGQTLGSLFVKHGAAKIQAVVNRSEHSSQRAIEFIEQGQWYASVAAIPHADLTLITVPDQQIAAIATEMALNSHLQPGAVVMHCSGALTSDSLEVLHLRDCAVASIHPAFSFKEPGWSVTRFHHTTCVLEGDAKAAALIAPLFSAIGALVYQIPVNNKALYHAAAVFASNFPIALLQQAHHCFLGAGLNNQEAKNVMDSLLQSMVDNVKQAPEPKMALTGPIQRADLTTLGLHMQVLTDPVVREFYLMMAKRTLEIAALDDESKLAVETIIET